MHVLLYTLLKMGAYFRNGFELNIAEHKLLRITIPHLEVDSVIEISHARSLAKQIGIVFMYFWITIMIRQYRACFILHSG